MMCSILLSINPKHVNNIMNGTKCYEFRKNSMQKHVDKILIYCTMPIMKVVEKPKLKIFLLISQKLFGRKQKENQELIKNFLINIMKIEIRQLL